MKKTLITFLALSSVALCADSIQSWDLQVYKNATEKVDQIVTGNGNFFFSTAGAELDSYMFDFTLTRITGGGYNVTLFATDRGAFGNAATERQGLTFLTWTTDHGGVGDGITHNGENGGNILTLSQGDVFRFAYDSVSSTAYLYNVTTSTLATRNLDADNERFHLRSGTSNNNLGASVVYTNSGDNYASYGNVYDLSSLAGNDVAFSTYVKTMTVVPEPTTATLSLLALAGLAARRRRK